MTTPAASPADIAIQAANPAAPAADPVVTEPVVTEPVAPVLLDEPAVVEPTAEPTDDPATVSGPVVYEPTGDAGLDVALSFVGNLGIGMDDPAMLATETGDFSLIEAKLATMGDKATGWQQMVALAKQAYTNETARNTERNNKVTAAVVGVAGSQEAWTAMQVWASANATAEEKTELNAMFKAGPLQARAAAKLIMEQYQAVPSHTVEPASATRLAPSANQATSNTSLSARDYANEVKTLAKRIGSHNLATSPEYATLNRRRQAHN